MKFKVVKKGSNYSKAVFNSVEEATREAEFWYPNLAYNIVPV